MLWFAVGEVKEEMHTALPDVAIETRSLDQYRKWQLWKEVGPSRDL